MPKGNETTQKILTLKNKYIIILIVLLIIALAFCVFLLVTNKGEETIITSSTLTRAIDISELSTAQYTYNGIAEIYKDEEHNKVKCHVRYNATVKAGIDIKALNLDNIDHKNKTIKPVLPEINITTINVDENSFSFIPEKVDVELKEVIMACQTDVLTESKNSSALIDSARDNLKAVIESLLLPITISQNYKIIWD